MRLKIYQEVDSSVEPNAHLKLWDSLESSIFYPPLTTWNQGHHKREELESKKRPYLNVQL